MKELKLVDVNFDNISECDPICFLNSKNEGYKKKIKWMKKRFDEGLKIKLLYLKDLKKPLGFIEYVPGEYVWRAVDAKGYMFIHCIWVSRNKYKEKGYGSLLIKEAIKDAKRLKMKGVAVITSDGPFMAKSKIFLKNKFKLVEEDSGFQLLVKSFEKAPMPKFKDWKKQLKKYKGLNIIYSIQCPWVAQSIDDMKKISKKKKLKLKVKEMKSAKQAQNAPSIYSAFNLIYNGKILADRYISERRFENIIKKELKAA